MTEPAWGIAIERRGTAADGRPRYTCYVHIVPMPNYCNGGTCGKSVPAYSMEGVTRKVRSILDDIRAGQWHWPEKPRPAPETVELTDKTGEFTKADFFDRGTLAAFLSPEAET